MFESVASGSLGVDSVRVMKGEGGRFTVPLPFVYVAQRDEDYPKTQTSRRVCPFSSLSQLRPN